jgi:hypothetical protein
LRFDRSGLKVLLDHLLRVFHGLDLFLCHLDLLFHLCLLGLLAF